MTIKKTDAELTFFIGEELESVVETVRVKYPDAKYSTLIPVDSSDDEGAESVGYTQYDGVGVSEIMADGADDSPNVDVFGQKILLPVFEIGNHFNYTAKELRANSMAGKSIDSERAVTSARAVEQHHDYLAMESHGAADRRDGKMYGVVEHPNVTKIESAKTWTLATAEEIIADFALMDSRVIKDTKETFTANTFAMGGDIVALLRGKYLTGTTISVLTYLKDTYSEYSWLTHFRLGDYPRNPATGATADTNVVLCYHRSPEVLKYKMPMPYKLYSAVHEGRKWRVEAASSSAGVEVKQPLAVVVFYGV